MCLVLLVVGQIGQGLAQLDDVFVALNPVVEERKFVDDFLGCLVNCLNIGHVTDIVRFRGPINGRGPEHRFFHPRDSG